MVTCVCGLAYIVPCNTCNTICVYIRTRYTEKSILPLKKDPYHVNCIYVTMSILSSLLHSHIVSFAWCPHPVLVMEYVRVKFAWLQLT